jgi:hypothetical protein
MLGSCAGDVSRLICAAAAACIALQVSRQGCPVCAAWQLTRQLPDIESHAAAALLLLLLLLLMALRVHAVA